MEITAVTSGQDGIGSARILAERELVDEMDKKYPGLRSILMDPYGSLYLNEGMYEMALEFLADRIAKHGGEMEIISFFDINNLEGTLMREALDHLCYQTLM